MCFSRIFPYKHPSEEKGKKIKHTNRISIEKPVARDIGIKKQKENKDFKPVFLKQYAGTRMAGVPPANFFIPFCMKRRSCHTYSGSRWSSILTWVMSRMSFWPGAFPVVFPRQFCVFCFFLGVSRGVCCYFIRSFFSLPILSKQLLESGTKSTGVKYCREVKAVIAARVRMAILKYHGCFFGLWDILTAVFLFPIIIIISSFKIFRGELTTREDTLLLNCCTITWYCLQEPPSQQWGRRTSMPMLFQCQTTLLKISVQPFTKKLCQFSCNHHLKLSWTI